MVGCTWLLSPVVPLVSSFLSNSLGLILFSSSLLLDWLHCPLLCASALHLSPPSPPHPQPQPHMYSTVQHPPHPSPSPPIFHNPFIPPLQHSTSTRSGWAGPLEGHHTLSYLSRIFLHQGLRQKPHTQCCGFGRKIFVKLLPVFALWAVQCDRLIC